MRFINCSYDIICNKQDSTRCGKTKQNNALTQYDDVLHFQNADVKGSFFFFVKLKGLESKRGKIDNTCSFLCYHGRNALFSQSDVYIAKDYLYEHTFRQRDNHKPLLTIK